MKSTGTVYKKWTISSHVISVTCFRFRLTHRCPDRSLVIQSLNPTQHLLQRRFDLSSIPVTSHLLGQTTAANSLLWDINQSTTFFLVCLTDVKVVMTPWSTDKNVFVKLIKNCFNERSIHFLRVKLLSQALLLSPIKQHLFLMCILWLLHPGIFFLLLILQ